MTFFPPDKLRRRKIDIDRSSVNSESPEVQNRLDRIDDHYRQLDVILMEVEQKIQADEQLRAIDQSHGDIEIQTEPRKGKWRRSSGKSGGKPRPGRSANPRKPR